MNISHSLLQKTLNGLWLRQETTMDNIANYSTPGYKSKQVDFETHLRRIINDSGDKKSSDTLDEIQSSNVFMVENEEESQRLDGNNVDLEKENIELARTQLQYMYTVTEINSYFSKLKSVISEGKK